VHIERTNRQNIFLLYFQKGTLRFRIKLMKNFSRLDTKETFTVTQSTSCLDFKGSKKAQKRSYPDPPEKTKNFAKKPAKKNLQILKPRKSIEKPQRLQD
jgi:hypothetical protein